MRFSAAAFTPSAAALICFAARAGVFTGHGWILPDLHPLLEAVDAERSLPRLLATQRDPERETGRLIVVQDNVVLPVRADGERLPQLPPGHLKSCSPLAASPVRY
jgi:hypothetical protein